MKRKYRVKYYFRQCQMEKTFEVMAADRTEANQLAIAEAKELGYWESGVDWLGLDNNTLEAIYTV